LKNIPTISDLLKIGNPAVPQGDEAIDVPMCSTIDLANSSWSGFAAESQQIFN